MKTTFTTILYSLIFSACIYAQPASSIKKRNEKIDDGLIRSTQKRSTLFNQLTSEKKPGKKSLYSWDQDINDWNFEYHSVISYNSNGSIANEMMLDTNNNPFLRTNYSYDHNNKITEARTESYTNGTWMDFRKNVYIYNPQGELLLYEERLLLGNTWLIVHGEKYDIEYDVLNNTVSKIELQHYNQNYDTMYKTVEYFSPNNQLIKEERYEYINLQWVPTEQWTYMSDKDGTDTALLLKTWNGTEWENETIEMEYIWESSAHDFLSSNKVYTWAAGEWRLYQRESFERDQNGSLSYLLEDYLQGNWRPNLKIEEQKDQYKNRVGYIYNLWQNGSWALLFEIVVNIKYDNEGNILERITAETDFQGELQNISKEVFDEYIVIAGVSDNKVMNINIYPNPADDFINLKYSDLSFHKHDFEIRNSEGKVVVEGKTDEQSQIKVTGLMPGIYFLNINSNSLKYSGKFLKK